MALQATPILATDRGTTKTSKEKVTLKPLQEVKSPAALEGKGDFSPRKDFIRVSDVYILYISHRIKHKMVIVSH